MTIKPIFKGFAVLLLCGMMFSASAASISFDMNTYTESPPNQVAVTIHFDFTDIAMLGGGFNVLYDSSVLEFVSYTQNAAVFSGVGAPQMAASPIGALDSPGNYLGSGLGSFDFFTGINIAGDIGTFVFTVLGAGGDGGCGVTLCLTPVPANPMFNLGGADITDSVFASGITAANIVDPTPVELLRFSID